MTGVAGEPVPTAKTGGSVIPPGHVWLSSDAGKGYLDSTFFGPVREADVSGVVVAVVWPPDRFAVASNMTAAPQKAAVVAAAKCEA